MSANSPPSKRLKLGSSPPSSGNLQAGVMQKSAAEEEADADVEHCSICLQPIVDRAVIPTCSHEFCFECLLVWTEQSRRCPLCSQTMGEYLIHHIRSKYDYQKHYLIPLRTSPHPLAAQQNARRRAQVRREHEWGRRQRRAWEEADELQRAIERRRWVYRHNLYAKHVATNSYTHYRPFPAPAQFSADPVLISRATAFIRRELQVWVGLDVEFLTTFTLSLMKSLDIRSEPAIRLLAEFLDMDSGGSRVNAEHFAHELYCYLRSPFRDIGVYDSVVQYDAPENLSSPTFPEHSRRWGPRSRSRSHSPSSSSSSVSIRSYSRCGSSSPSPPQIVPLSPPARRQQSSSHDGQVTRLDARLSRSRRRSSQAVLEHRTDRKSHRRSHERGREAPYRRQNGSRGQSRDRERLRSHSCRYEASAELVSDDGGYRDAKGKGKTRADGGELDDARVRFKRDVDDVDEMRQADSRYVEGNVSSATASGHTTHVSSGVSPPSRSSDLPAIHLRSPKSKMRTVSSGSVALPSTEASLQPADQLLGHDLIVATTTQIPERTRPPIRFRNRNLLESVQAHLADHNMQPRFRKQHNENEGQETGPYLSGADEPCNGRLLPAERTDSGASSLLLRICNLNHDSHRTTAASPFANSLASATSAGDALTPAARKLSAPDIMARARARLARLKASSESQDNSNGPAYGKDGVTTIDGNVTEQLNELGAWEAPAQLGFSAHANARVPRSGLYSSAQENEILHVAGGAPLSASANMRSGLLSRLAEEKRLQSGASLTAGVTQLSDDRQAASDAVPMVVPSRNDKDQPLDDTQQSAMARAAQREVMLRSQAQSHVRLAKAKRLAAEHGADRSNFSGSQGDAPTDAVSREKLLRATLVRRNA